MATAVEGLTSSTTTRPGGNAAATPASRPRDVAATWIWTQSINVARHAAALRPFGPEEFGKGAEAPTPGHLQAVNRLIRGLRAGLLHISKDVRRTAAATARQTDTAHLQRMVRQKAKAHHWVRGIEKIWDFYLELFGQRQADYAKWLLSCDRIALDCYRVSYLGLGVAREVPAPPPFCYMATGFAPATFRRAIPLKKLGKQLNPFPLIQLPYHRMVNPWTLGAVLHECSHNLQSDLGLSKHVPRSVGRRLLKEGMSPEVARAWVRWNREMFADMSALLLGGPLIAGSLMDILAREPETVSRYNSVGPHPTPFFRMLINTELLRRMGFEAEARTYRRLWLRIYPRPTGNSIPKALLRTFEDACPAAVDAMCYQPYPSLGRRSLAQVLNFGHKEQSMIEEASQRLAGGTDPGIIPERFLIGACRLALIRKLARPQVVTKNFYRALASG